MEIQSKQDTTLINHPLHFVRNVVLKALLLFLAANLVFSASYPLAALGRISAYNHLFPGRLRLPYGDNPTRAYNLSLYNLEAMFAAHEINQGDKPENEYRILMIGDSSVWGFLLPVQDTLSSYLNREFQGKTTPEGKVIRVYNLGYPVMSVTKDLLILSYALDYQADLIVWLVTLESMPYDKQLFPPLLQENPDQVKTLIQEYQLNLEPDSDEFHKQSFWDRTLIGARRPLADLVRLQLYGLMWASTGIDQDIPNQFEARMEDLPADERFHNLNPPHLYPTDLALDVLAAGVQMAGDIPILFVNEPMFISQGENSHIRYNFYYPRWAYDDYRQIMLSQSKIKQWNYFDLWNAVSNNEFTNSAVHLTAEGSRQLALKLAQILSDIFTQFR